MCWQKFFRKPFILKDSTNSHEFSVKNLNMIAELPLKNIKLSLLKLYQKKTHRKKIGQESISSLHLETFGDVVKDKLKTGSFFSINSNKTANDTNLLQVNSNFWKWIMQRNRIPRATNETTKTTRKFEKSV